MRRRNRRSAFLPRESLILGVARLCLITWLLVVIVSSLALAQIPASEGKPRATGDFQPGERIIVITRGDSTRTDTLTVQSDRTILFQQLPPISLDGVLRSDVQSCISQQLQQYVKHDIVRVIPLVSVGVLGEVVHPGYYRVPLQISLGDLLMVAGGPSAQADMNRVQVRRGRTLLLGEHSVRDAMVRRLPLDELGIDAGDEVILESPHQRNWLLITQIAGVATGLLLTLHSLKVF